MVGNMPFMEAKFWSPSLVGAHLVGTAHTQKQDARPEQDCCLLLRLYTLSIWTLSELVAEVGNYNYGPGHPMKPHRIRMCHNLLVNYGVYKKLQVFVQSILTHITSSY